MGANNIDFTGGALHARDGQIGDQGTGFESNNTKFAGPSSNTAKFGEEEDGNRTNENAFAGNANTRIASSGTF